MDLFSNDEDPYFSNNLDKKVEELKEEDDPSDYIKKLLIKETDELFGLFPSRDNIDAKIIMLSLEITRVHQRQ